ncbi:MAG: hypothetical protein K5866_08570 [Treponema sp.]|nr:hypothetical protein [Treponema sp.]
MKKLNLIAAFFISLIIFTSCQNVTKGQDNNLIIDLTNDFAYQTEEVVVELPGWPPEDNLQEKYPALDKWLIEINSKLLSKKFYTCRESFILRTYKNQPVSILAKPLTILSNNSTCQFFYPAGTLYPYEWKDSAIKLKWELGFSADLMKSLFLSPLLLGISPEELNYYLMTFNWKKFNSIIQEKIQNSIFEFSEDFKSATFYNPWQSDQKKLLENLSSSKFSQNLLKTKNVVNLPLDNIGLPPCQSIFSPFIPENQILGHYGIFALKKEEDQILMLDNEFADIINSPSIKKVSHHLIYMPIFIDDYENTDFF